MSSELIVNASLPETRIALMESGEIQELLVERAAVKGIVGNIYKGRVTRVLPGMQAAFVDIGLDKAAFLYVDDVYVRSDIWETDGGHSEEDHDHEGHEEAHQAGSSEAQEPSAEAAPPATEGESPVDADVASEQSDADAAADDVADSDSEDDDGEEDPGNIVGMTAEGDSPDGAIPQEKKFPKRGAGNRRRRGRSGPRRRGPADSAAAPSAVGAPGEESMESMPENYQEQMSVNPEEMSSDRSEMEAPSSDQPSEGDSSSARPQEAGGVAQRQTGTFLAGAEKKGRRPEFNQPRSADRRIKPKMSQRGGRGQVNIQDLLQEGQEVIVQVAKDPIATKGARLTCHISLPGRYLVCMPTIDHVGVSRRIDRDDDRRKLRDIVERNRPKKLGFIVRTAIGRNNTEKRIKQDIDYLSGLWTEIREKASVSSAPALVYEDLNAVLRSIRDWVNEEIDKIIVDSRYHFGEIQRFVAHFMPAIRHKIELYQGDIPIFDAYGISSEMSRALDRKVWLKSGGYLVVDQAEALVAIDVNTGRFVGKRNLEDTILKTNLEAVKEIAYQLRLRNCGGIIILDLIDMEVEENRHRVYRALEEALKKDRARPSIMKISDIGLIEMTRKRTRDTAIRIFCEPCAHCEGKGYIKTKQTVAYEVMREVERVGTDRDCQKILVQAHPDVIDFLAIDERDAIDQLERKYRKSVYLQAVLDTHPEQFDVLTEKKERERKQQMEAQQQQRQQSQQQRQERQEQQGRHSERQPERIQPVIVPVSSAAPTSDEPKRSFLAPGSQFLKPQSPIVPIIRPREDVSGESVGNSVAAADPDAQPMAPPAPLVPRDDMDEEDRLAFLRAQAAQDAAIAQMQAGRAGGNTAAPGRPQGPNGGGPRHNSGGGGRHQNQNNRGRRGARGGRGGSGGGGGRFHPAGGQRSFQPHARPQSFEPVSTAGLTIAPDTGSSSGSDDGTNGGSTPPTT